MSIPRFFPYTVKLLKLLKKYEQEVGEQLPLKGPLTTPVGGGFVTVHTPLPSGCQLRGDAGQR